jgi:L-fuculose-phosphate aldolase
MTSEEDARKDIVAACRELNASGLSEGTSGNISVRHGDRMLISPSATPYGKMTPDMIASLDLSGEMTGEWGGPLKPSTEWRIHWRLLKERPDLTAVVHAHPPHCTALAILRKSIPACHYMVAAFGGMDVRCAGYHTFGSAELAGMVVAAMEDRTACLMANHGMVVAGKGLERAMWRAVELETLARQFHLSSLMGEPVILSEEEMAETFRMFAGYGLRDD